MTGLIRREIYLVRHAEPLRKDKRSYYLGQSDPPLSITGVEQAEQLAGYFEERPIQAIYCSDLARAEQTASIIANRQHYRPVKMKEFREIDLGEWDGLPVEEVKKTSPAQYKKRGEDIVNFRPPGGESFADLRQRVLPAFKRTVESTTGNIVIVAHAGVNRVILSSLMQIDLEKLFSIRQRYGQVNLILKDERGYTVEGKNEHL